MSVPGPLHDGRVKSADPGTAPAILLQGVGISRSGTPVVADLSLRVDQGESWALIGLNGAGKSTCMKGMLDLIEVTAGHIELFGERHLRTRSRARLAYLPERFLAPYFLTGAEFLRHMARLYGSSSEPATFDDMCARLDLGAGALRRPVRTYSKGMGQKLGLAACLLSGKPLLVLDEPMSGLDPSARARVRRELASLRDRGQTLFFSTHLLEDVSAVCDHVAVIHRGRLLFAGSLAQLQAEHGTDGLEAAFLACLDAVDGRLATPER